MHLHVDESLLHDSEQVKPLCLRERFERHVGADAERAADAALRGEDVRPFLQCGGKAAHHVRRDDVPYNRAHVVDVVRFHRLNVAEKGGRLVVVRKARFQLTHRKERGAAVLRDGVVQFLVDAVALLLLHGDGRGADCLLHLHLRAEPVHGSGLSDVQHEKDGGCQKKEREQHHSGAMCLERLIAILPSRLLL